jgi:hypothetical protein
MAFALQVRAGWMFRPVRVRWILTQKLKFGNGPADGGIRHAGHRIACIEALARSYLAETGKPKWSYLAAVTNSSVR